MLHVTPAPPAKSASSSPPTAGTGTRPASGNEGSRQPPVRQSQTFGTGHVPDGQRSTHSPRITPASFARCSQTRFGGHTTPAQSSTHTPPAQCEPPAQATPAQLCSTQRGTGNERSHVSSAAHPLEPAKQSHAATHRPSRHVEPAPHVNEAQGSVQFVPRQRSPNGHFTSGVQSATQRLASSHVKPGRQPNAVQSGPAHRRRPLGCCSQRLPTPQPKSSRGGHCITHMPSRQPRWAPQNVLAPGMPLQSRSFGESQRSGAPGNAFGSRSSQSHAAPAGAHAHATKPSRSSSAQGAPASQPGPALARASPAAVVHAEVATTTASTAAERRRRDMRRDSVSAGARCQARRWTKRRLRVALARGRLAP